MCLRKKMFYPSQIIECLGLFECELQIQSSYFISNVWFNRTIYKWSHPKTTLHPMKQRSILDDNRNTNAKFNSKDRFSKRLGLRSCYNDRAREIENNFTVLIILGLHVFIE